MSRARGPKPLSPATRAILDATRRRRGERELEKRFLIVCEDTKSAKGYFDALVKHLNLSATSVVVGHSGGHTQPIQVVREAISRKKLAASRQSGTEPFDQVWCVIDGDCGAKIGPARQSADAHEIRLAVTTKCFEYWLILHFEEYDQSALNCDAVVSYLKKHHLPGYRKGKCDFRDVVANFRAASERAERLRKPGIGRGDRPEDQDPCSEIYKLINSLLASKDGGGRRIGDAP